MRLRFIYVLAALLGACVGEVPGQAPEASALGPDRLLINEVYAFGGMDWFEVLNVGESAADLARISFVTGSGEEPRQVSSVVILPPGEVHYVPVRGFELGFGLEDADHIKLLGPNGAVLDRVDWSDTAAVMDRSFGRVPDGDSRLGNIARPTPGDSNGTPTQRDGGRLNWLARR